MPLSPSPLFFSPLTFPLGFIAKPWGTYIGSFFFKESAAAEKFFPSPHECGFPPKSPLPKASEDKIQPLSRGRFSVHKHAKTLKPDSLQP